MVQRKQIVVGHHRSTPPDATTRTTTLRTAPACAHAPPTKTGNHQRPEPKAPVVLVRRTYASFVTRSKVPSESHLPPQHIITTHNNTLPIHLLPLFLEVLSIPTGGHSPNHKPATTTNSDQAIPCIKMRARGAVWGTWLTLVLSVSWNVENAAAQTLDAAELERWQTFFNATGGPEWGLCRNRFATPCQCGQIGSSGRKIVNCANGKIVEM
jgi:hypothetical protein